MIAVRVGRVVGLRTGVGSASQNSDADVSMGGASWDLISN